MPEPVVVIGGAIALLMMLGGKKKKTTQTADETGHVPGGGSDSKTPVGDPDGGVKGGGTKRPGGGWDDSDYVPPTNLGPNDLWIAPDCGGVIEGDTWWANKMRPRAVQLARNWRSQRTWAPSMNDIMGAALGQFVYHNTPEPLLEPGSIPSCMTDWPGFHWGSIFRRTATEDSRDRYQNALNAYNANFPATGGYLEHLKQRMLADPELFSLMLWAQDIKPYTFYIAGVDESLMALARGYLDAIADGRRWEEIEPKWLANYYPELGFPEAPAMEAVIRTTGTNLRRSEVPWDLRESGPMTFALNTEAQRREYIEAAINGLINEAGWYAPPAGSPTS